MWETLQRRLDQVRMTIWVHGAEIQDWHRRNFDAMHLTPREVERRVKLGAQRIELWREVLRNPHPNLHLVFVSDYLAQQAFADVGVMPDPRRYSVIHNFIDGNLFPYREKAPESRFKVLAIRPFSSRIYGNDLIVAAIEALSKRPIFAQMTFHLVGDGDLFESTTAPLAHLPNVKLERRFLSQSEIAVLHRDYGVFLVPSRMDTQGVSRGEAMASGLVPVTTSVAAIPEFVDAASGLLVETENALELADALQQIVEDPALFARLSQGAAERVRLQCDAAATIERELALLLSPTAAASAARAEESVGELAG
jgi:glycosyltransferase involved in cell wall biosynthesis